MTDSSIPSYVETLYARQPILDREQRLWGYELLYRHDVSADKASFLDADAASLTVAACSMLSSMIQECKQLRYHVNFTESLVLDEVPLALPAEQTVVEVPESMPADTNFFGRLRELKDEGYTIALDDYTGAAATASLAALADILKIDMLRQSDAALQELVNKAREAGATPLAMRVEDREVYEKGKSLGFKLFQGYFFMAPEVMPGRRITSSEAAKLRLFKLLKEQEANPDFDVLAQAINADVSISYRLLSLLNSPSFGLVSEVRSIKQALVLLGWKQLKNWLRVVILTDLTPSGKPPELVVSSALRGRFLQNAAAACHWETPQQDAMFMLGLFSLLDAMLDMPMDALVEHLPLEEEILEALVGRENRFSPWLSLALSFELGDWSAVDTLMRGLQLDAMSIARAYRDAMRWSAQYFQQL